MFKSNFLCTNCGTSSPKEYISFICEFGALPLLWSLWSYDYQLSSYSRCAKCGNVFLSVFEEDGVQDSTLPLIIERCMFQIKMGAPDHSMHSSHVEPINAETVKKGFPTCGLSGGLYLDISVWIALAVASGVIGNLAYDVIKSSILAARRKLIATRKIQRQSFQPEKHLDPNTTFGDLIKVVDKVFEENLRRGDTLYDIPKLSEDEVPYFEKWCKLQDKYSSRRIEHWQSLSEERIISQIEEIYEYTRKRLRGISIKKEDNDEK